MRIAALLSLVAALGFAPDSLAGARVGSAAPVLPMTRLDGHPLSAAATLGKVTVLNFWATWCPPCRAETPDLVTAYANLHPAGVAFLGIDTTETAPIVKTFLSAKGVGYPIALAGPAVYNAYGISYIPTTIVLDAQGIVRARWIGKISPAQLAHYVTDARAGRSSTYVSPAQAQIDALLAPDRYHFDGTPAERKAAVASVDAAIAQSEHLAGQDHAGVDYERTQRAEGTLLVAAGTAVRGAADSPAAKVDGLRLIARGKGDLMLWADAIEADRDALALTPDAPKLVAELSRAYYRQHDYAQMIEQAEHYTELMPNDGDGWSELGLAYERSRDFHAAARAYDKALALLSAPAMRADATQDAVADVADTALDAADVTVALGDRSATARNFALANRYADRLDAHGEYADLERNVKERTQEGLVAVALAAGDGKPVVSVVPWTGPDLPGSLESTLKYRLIVAAPADTSVTLRAIGLRPQWVASFCADGLCSPQIVSFKSPAAGVKTYEFQLVPPRDGAQPGAISIGLAPGGSVVAVPRRDKRATP